MTRHVLHTCLAIVVEMLFTANYNGFLTTSRTKNISLDENLHKYYVRLRMLNDFDHLNVIYEYL